MGDVGPIEAGRVVGDGGFLLGVAELFPLIDEAGVDLADRFSQPLLEVPHRLGSVVLGHGLCESLVGLAQVAEDGALGALQAMVFDVLAEVEARLVELAGHRLGLHVLAPHPRMVASEHVECPV